MPTIWRERRTDICCMYDIEAWMNEWVNELSDSSYSQKNLNMMISTRAAEKDMHIIYSTETQQSSWILFECLAIAVYEFWNSNILSSMLNLEQLSTWWPGINGVFHFSSHIELIWILWNEGAISNPNREDRRKIGLCYWQAYLNRVIEFMNKLANKPRPTSSMFSSTIVTLHFVVYMYEFQLCGFLTVKWKKASSKYCSNAGVFSFVTNSFTFNECFRRGNLNLLLNVMQELEFLYPLKDC